MADEEIAGIRAEHQVSNVMDKAAKAAEELAKPSMTGPAVLVLTEDAAPLPSLGSRLKVLMVWPRFAPSFWSLSGTMAMVPQKAVQPPLGLLTIAALCPADWTLRLIDCSVEELGDADILWADLVMVSGMRLQHEGIAEVLARARALRRRTIIGGPHASAEPGLLLPLADHVVVGEPDEVFANIAADLECGTAKRLYVVDTKPDITHSPAPRYDLLKLDKYLLMSVQFSRGCPFQCEFCDIITIYGRRPRTKTTEQTLREFDVLYKLGWRNRIFIVDDNFVGNRKRAFDLVQGIRDWQRRHGTPFVLWTEASMDLAQHQPLLEAMVAANFWSIFIGIETPSAASLIETRKLQNLRQDPFDSIRAIQQAGLWISAGFIVGFDSDTPDIFERQVQFIERAGIAYAMAGFLIALPTTPLFDRMKQEGRLIEDMTINRVKGPNFRTVMPRRQLLAGGIELLRSIYAPKAYFDRAFRSLALWNVHPSQKAPVQPRSFMRRVLLRSILLQGIRSSYRRQYWRFLIRSVRQWRDDPQRRWMALTLLVSGHHFIQYARTVTAELEEELHGLPVDTPPMPRGQSGGLIESRPEEAIVAAE